MDNQSAARLLQKKNEQSEVKNLGASICQTSFDRRGVADSIGPGDRTEQEVRYLVKKGYLLDDRGLKLSEKGLACMDSANLKKRARWAEGV